MNRHTILAGISIALLLILEGSMSKHQVDSFNLPLNSKNPPLVATEIQPVTNQQKLIAANNQLGFKLFTNLVETKQSNNVFISPPSIAIALAMAYNGADGTTKSAMAETLQLKDLSLQEVNFSYRQLHSQFQQSDPAVSLSIANSLWAKRGIPFKHQFLNRSQEFYQAQVTNLDFSNPGSKNIINNCIKQATNGKIDLIVDRIKPEDVLFLINAIYFKGNWANQFEVGLTKEQPFHLSSNFSKPHPIMFQNGKYNYYENEQFQAISLPYGNQQFSMYILLPQPDSNLGNLYQDLTADNWQQWMKEFKFKSGSIQLPRFTLDYEVELNKVLTALGMGIIFDREKADFTQMTSQSVFVDRIKHKTFMEVNEEGTEAAGSTSIGISITSAIVEEPFEMIVNRPFFCAITDEQTGAVLFMGSIVNPT